MLNPTVRVLTIACAVAAMLAMPAGNAAAFFGWCHHTPAPTYAAAPVAVAPVCNTCPTQTCGYAPTVVTAYQPVYQPVAPCSSCASYAVTTYRPPFAWAYQGSLVPYTTYRPVYAAYRPVYAAMPVVAYSGSSSCTACSPCTSCSSCGGGYSTATYEAPASGCSSCAASAAVVAPQSYVESNPPCVVPAAVATPVPYGGSQEAPPAAGAAPPSTFKSDKPTAAPEQKPTSQIDAHPNSAPAPQLPDPQNRTASRSDYSSVRVALVASPVQAAPPQDYDGWQPARD
jgi:hypothetical protein